MTADLATIEAALAAATPGPWYWRNTQSVMLLGGRSKLVMSFERMGMQGAQPLFRDERNIMQPGGRANLYDFPDAYLIANAPTWLAELVERVRDAEDGLAAVIAQRDEQEVRAKRAEAEVERLTISDYGRLQQTVALQTLAADRRGRAETAEATIARVRELHQEQFQFCRECDYDWPCPTIRALDANHTGVVTSELATGEAETGLGAPEGASGESVATPGSARAVEAKSGKRLCRRHTGSGYDECEWCIGGEA